MSDELKEALEWLTDLEETYGLPSGKEYTATIRAHIERLEARLSTALEDRREWYAKAAERLKWTEAAEARVRKLEADARRYRWLRDNAVRCLDNPDANYVGSELRFRFDHLRDETLDAAIDTAMQGEI